MYIQPKKWFGQHFLKDKHIAQRICESLQGYEAEDGENFAVLEIGPGLGVLTQFLYPEYKERLYMVEIDREMIAGLKTNYHFIEDHVFEQDFLDMDLAAITDKELAIIGNFPYNISSQILFKVVENHSIIPQLVGMFQKEVAQRVVAKPGTKIYGLISAWVQAFYEIEYLFTVNEGSFSPPPKVKSAVIRLNRKEKEPACGHKLLLLIIKAAFNQRRKTLRNALGTFKDKFNNIHETSLLDKRAEELGFEEFIGLAQAFEVGRKP